MALEYMRLHQPRVVYIAMNDTDDLAHSRRYDRLLDALRATDDFLRDLWHAVERQPAYRGRTTLILTTDHGRGRTPADWTDHGEGVSGSEDIWLAVIGPGTPPRGEVSGGREIHQADVAATLLACLGLDPARFNPAGGPPVPEACEAPPGGPAEPAR
jgi:bisphosphoglycerate-independent phosphoglycerate mutase (AlkP superfamily)